MNWSMIQTLVAKDLRLFWRDRFFALVSVLALVAYAILFYVMPATVDETLSLALYAPSLPAVVGEQLQAEGLVLGLFGSEEELRQAVLAGEYPIGAAFAPDFMAQLAAGQTTEVRVYVPASAPAEFQAAYTLLVGELAGLFTGRPIRLEAEQVVLGEDRAGSQIPFRQRLLPIMGVFVLMMETLGLASLMSSEIEGRTAAALLITPLRVEGLFVAKGITGVLLAFSQTAILMALTGGLAQRPGLVLTALLLGALLVTGIGFVLAAAARDFMGVIGVGILAIVALALPGIGVLVPGLVSGWVRLIPSYYLVDAVYQATALEGGWATAGSNLLILFVWALAFLALGVWVLRRRLL